MRATTGGRKPPWLVAGMALLVAGCSLDGLLGTDELPADVTDPAVTETPEGATAAYHGTLAQFRMALGAAGGQRGSFTAITALLSDELQQGDNFPQSYLRSVDVRYTPESEENGAVADSYSRLQRVRGQAAQAIGLLTRYAPDSEALTAHMYAVQAYAEIFLAELFCSGVPLSTLDYGGDFTYRPGSTTDEVYGHALALLDSASTLVGDSVRIEHMIRLGRARALLALSRFADAAAAVVEVTDDYHYDVSYSGDAQSFASLVQGSANWTFTVSDVEGLNGLDYVSGGDPRVRVTASGTNARGLTIYHPDKYETDGSGMIVLASGIEARLAEAEAALDGGDVTSWLDALNHLRQTAWPTITPAVAGPLSELEDPGTPTARVDLLFRERAFWLFLTGHRQGDLRRLMRHYGRAEGEVYPIGGYPGTGGQSYGSHADLPIPPVESVNPHFAGCASRGA